MKATELRIGNLVYGINRRSEVHLPNETPLKVWQIEIFNCEVLPPDKNPAEAESYLKISNVDITGIPLTDKWLLKLGFTFKVEELGARFYERQVGIDFISFSKDGHWNINSGKSYWYMDRNFKSPKYVHELQNLYFAMTGTDLIIQSLEGGQEKLKEKNNVA